MYEKSFNNKKNLHMQVLVNKIRNYSKSGWNNQSKQQYYSNNSYNCFIHYTPPSLYNTNIQHTDYSTYAFYRQYIIFIEYLYITLI